MNINLENLNLQNIYQTIDTTQELNSILKLWKKIVFNPVVEINGDEMTRIIWEYIVVSVNFDI